jgi:hypothetical protein
LLESCNFHNRRGEPQDCCMPLFEVKAARTYSWDGFLVHEMVMLTREKRALWNLSPKRQQPRKDNNNQISSNDYLLHTWWDQIFLKNSWKNEWKQDSDLANQTAESNLLVIISWLWSHALILCYGAIPLNPILPKFLA